MGRNADAASLAHLKKNAVRGAERVITLGTLVFSYLEHIQQADTPWHGSAVDGITLDKLEQALGSSYRVPPEISAFGLAARDAYIEVIVRGNRTHRFTRPSLPYITSASPADNTNNNDSVIEAEYTEVTNND